MKQKLYLDNLRGGHWFYIPDNKRLKRIEQYIRKLTVKIHNHWHNVLVPLFKEVGKGNYVRYNDNYYQINISSYDNELTVFFTGNTEKYNYLNDDILAEKFHKAYSYNEALCKRKSLLEEMLDKSLLNIIISEQEEKYPDYNGHGHRFEDGKQYKFVINDQSYWYHNIYQYGWVNPWPVKLSWPKHQVKEYNLNK